jgi:hypothetical protein
MISMKEMAEQVDIFLSNFPINFENFSDFGIGYSLMKGRISVNINDSEEEQVRTIADNIAKLSKPFFDYTCNRWLDKRERDEKIEMQIEKFSNDLSRDNDVVGVILEKLTEIKGYSNCN